MTGKELILYILGGLALTAMPIKIKEESNEPGYAS